MEYKEIPLKICILISQIDNNKMYYKGNMRVFDFIKKLEIFFNCNKNAENIF